MNEKISVGEKFVDCDGEELQVLKIGKQSVVLRSEEKELFVASIDDLLMIYCRISRLANLSRSNRLGNARLAVLPIAFHKLWRV